MSALPIRATLTGAVALAAAALGTLVAATPAVAQAATAETTERIVISYLEVNGTVSEGFRAFGPVSGSGVGSQRWLDDHTIAATMPVEDGSLELTVTIGDEHVDFDPTACTAVFAWTGAWTVTGGTGAYAGVTGGGEAVQSKRIVGARVNGACQGPESGVDPQLISVRAVLSGAVNLP